MNNTKTDKHVLVATDYENMLEILNESNTVLDEIQKGLNDYLEKKRLFFPRYVIGVCTLMFGSASIEFNARALSTNLCSVHRFFFLSNNELLEILSETKEPLRVQPYLKKCFEGINLLQFTNEEVITGIISAEQEIVPLSGKIIPADAKVCICGDKFVHV